MTYRSPALYHRSLVLLAAGLLCGCAIEGPAHDQDQDQDASSVSVPAGYPPIDGAEKYFKPGPPIATADPEERDRRFAYHEQVIEAHGYSYTLNPSPPTELDLEAITGFEQPADTGTEKPQKPKSAPNIEVPERWDWREVGVGMPPIRQQGSCGSCWAFGSTAALEGAIAALDGVIVNLSEQSVLDCSNKGSCGGGWWAYNTFVSPGAVWEQDYPYVGYDQYCQSGQERPFTIESYHSLQSGDIDAMKAAIRQYGTIGVTMSVCGSIPGYGGGIYDSTECNNYYVNHIVALVGWDDTVQHALGQGVWVLRNSWGSNWGDGGYGYFAYGTARLEESSTYVVYQPEDPTDTDEDGITDVHDNCDEVANPSQSDEDHDGLGDVCDDTFDPYELTISMSDDDSRRIDLGFSFPFYDTGYTEVHVNSDGNLTFVSPDEATVARDRARFLTGAPRIAALYADLNPSSAGKVSWGKTAPDSVFVKFEDVKRYDKSGSGSVTVTLDASGDIGLSYGNVTGKGYIVGVSRGGEGNDAGQSDLGGVISYAGTNAVYEMHEQSFDLANQSLTLTPSDGPAPPPAETVIPLDDDDSRSLQIGFDFPFFGQTYSEVYVNSDGNLTFGQGDDASAKRDKQRFLTGAPRIAALFSDLDPATGGAVTYMKTDADTLEIRFKNVRLYGKSTSSSVVVSLHADGVIDLKYGQVAQGSYIVGISGGGAGNTVGEQDVSHLGLPIGYEGTNTIYQQFEVSEPFDLVATQISFSPDGGVTPPPPPPPEHFLSLGDDDQAKISLGFSFPFYGNVYDEVFVNSDGNLTFGSGDGGVTAPRDQSRFLTGAPRIALLFADLDPSAGGWISYRHDDATTTTISFLSVPEWGNGGASSARVTLVESGAITFDFTSVGLGSALVGVSRGGANNSASPVAISDLFGTSSYGTSSATFAVYDSADPFQMAGQSLTLTP